jgi:molybdopterin converting factor small subunit
MKVVLSGTIQKAADYQREYTVEGDTLGAALDDLATRNPNLKKAMYEEDGSVRGAHALFLNGNQIDSKDLAQPVQPWDELEVITSIAGG